MVDLVNTTSKVVYECLRNEILQFKGSCIEPKIGKYVTKEGILSWENVYMLSKIYS